MNHSFFHSKSMLAVTIAVLLQAANAPSAEAQLEIAQLNHPAKVSFQSEILPVLRKNCLACHNETDAESSLVLETPARMLEGGFEGPAVVPGKPEESYLFQLAAHTTEPIMPPEDNSAGAINLSPQELALLKQWITEGATDDSGESANQVAWQSLPPGVNPVFAVAMSGDGQIVAAGRANQISVYDVNSKRELQRLTDPALLESGVYDKPGVAHLDMVQALAFSRDGEWIASGGYRTLKLWRRQADMEPAETKPNNAADPSLLMPGIGADDLTAKISETIAVSVQANQMQVWSRTDGSSDWKSDHSIELASPAKQILPLGDSSFATLGQNNQFQVWNAQGNATSEWSANGGVVRAAVTLDGQRIAAILDGNLLRIWKSADGSIVSEIPAALQMERSVLDATLALEIADRQSNNAQKDLDEANNLKKQEEENLKKTQESLTNATSELTKKNEAKDAAVQAVQESQQAVTQIEQQLAENAAAVQQAQQQLASKASDLDKQFAEIAQVQQQLAAAEAAVDAANSKLQQVQSETGKSPEAEQDKQKLAAAQQSLQEANQKYESLDGHRENLIRQLADLNQQRIDLRQQPTLLNEKATQLRQQLEPLVKTRDEKQAAAAKANEEFQNSQKTKLAADDSLERANQAIARADESIQQAQQRLDQAKQFRAKQDELLASVKQQQDSFRPTWTDIALSPDGQLVATVNQDGLITTWNVDTKQALETRQSLSQPTSLRFINATDLLVTSESQQQRIHTSANWELATTIGSADGESPFADRILAIDFHPSESILAVGGGAPSRAGEVHLINYQNGQIIHSFDNLHSDTVFDVAFSQDGSRLATSGADRFMKVFDVATREFQRAFEGHTHHVLSVAWQADGRVLATAGADKVVKLWDSQSGSQLRTIQGFGKEVTGVQYLGASETFWAVSGDQTLCRCDLGGARNGVNRGNDFLYSVATDRFGRAAVFAGHDSIVRVVDKDGKTLVEFPPEAN